VSGSKRPRIVVTACGLISPLGFGLAENQAALFDNPRSAIGPVTLFDAGKNRCQIAAEIDHARLREIIAGKRQSRRLHRASSMMIGAATELAEADPGFEPDLTVIGTTSGGMSFGEAFFQRLRQSGSLRGAPTEVANYMPQKPVLDALDSRGWSRDLQIVSNACASGTNAIGMAVQAIRAGRARRVLAGGYDALAQLVFCGFDALQAASPTPCRPFDRHRDGLNLGEAAALLALEPLEEAEQRGAPMLAEIVGYGASTDTHHLTQPHPEGHGPRLSMERALADAGLEPATIDYINAHGTATPLNDQSETAAIRALFPPTVRVSSTKGFVGHTLGAAGALEAVFAVLALGTGRPLINLNLNEPDPDAEFALVTESGASNDAFRFCLSNSFGFGGANASLVLKGFHS